ncbi:hypothetical protein ACBP93_06390 [Paenalcaligenes hominis]|uniref:LpxL/LpxP family acyltransferase n=1 Tax=Paenalcaligenes hominis TaxID=643674 RepID=UPI0035265E96
MYKWKNKKERGSIFFLKLIVWLALHTSRNLCSFLLYPVTFYFFATDHMARRASADYLSTLKGEPAKFKDKFQHMYTFAMTLLDRVYMSHGQFHLFELKVENQHLLDEVLQQGRGCLLLGSHLGSFDLMMLAMLELDPRPLSVLMHVDPNAQVRSIAGVDLSELDVIPLGRPNSFLRAFQALQEGGVVAMLADRVDGGAALPVTFLGRETEMSIAPHVLSARHGAPTLLCFGLYEGDNKYRIVFTKGYDALAQHISGRDLQPAVNYYTQLLEKYVRQYPNNWFNFYPYWQPKDPSS